MTSMDDFFKAIESITVGEEEVLATDQIPLHEFTKLTTYYGSSPRILDSAILAALIQGHPQYLIQGLAGHLLLATGGPAPHYARHPQKVSPTP